MAKKVDKLNDAAKKKDDEFYSTPLVVQAFFRMLDPDALRGKKVWLPFDSERSEFTKWFENPENQAKWGWKEFRNTSDDFFSRNDMLDWCDIVVSNPPFSKECRILDALIAAGKEFAFVNPWAKTMYLVFYKYCLSAVSLDGQGGKYSLFDRPDGSTKAVAWNVVSNDRALLTKTQKPFKDRGRSFEDAVEKGLLKKTDPLDNACINGGCRKQPSEMLGRVLWHCVSPGDIPADFFEPVLTSPCQFALANSEIHEKFEILESVYCKSPVRVEGRMQFDRIIVRRRK